MPLKELLHKYLQMGSRFEIINSIRSHMMTFEELRVWGFPVCNSSGTGSIYIAPEKGFGNSSDRNIQTCRCGKSVSLLQQNWWYDEDGCSYHTGKKISTGPKRGMYSCCGSFSRKDGCVHTMFHISCYKFARDMPFRMADEGQICDDGIYALDTEMVYTRGGMEVAHVSLVDISGNVLVDVNVLPQTKVIDYATPYSGIKPQDLEDAVSFETARSYILDIMTDQSILIGHALQNDLIALAISHDKIIDTSILFPHQKGYPFRLSLKTLAAMHLEDQLCEQLKFHDAVEDARISLALALKKCSLSANNTVQTIQVGGYSFISRGIPSYHRLPPNPHSTHQKMTYYPLEYGPPARFNSCTPFQGLYL